MQKDEDDVGEHLSCVLAVDHPPPVCFRKLQDQEDKQDMERAMHFSSSSI